MSQHLSRHLSQHLSPHLSLVGSGVLLGTPLNIVILAVTFIIAVVQENTRDFP